MNRTIRVTALALIGISLLAGSAALSLPQGSRSADAATQTVAVENTPLQFSPAALTISVGDTVQWDWPAAPNVVPHTVTSSDLVLDSPLQAEGSFSHIFSAAGTYNYQCNVHPAEMTGTITVQVPAPTATSTSTAAATNTAVANSTRTATPVATGTAVASVTPVITPTNTSGVAPTVIAPAPPPVAPAPSGGAAGAGGLPRAGTGGAADAPPLPRISIVLALAGLLALSGAAATWRRA
jgi:plastocyanin